jgi:hypothetical protein
MPKRLSKGKRPRDVNQLAYQLVRESTEQELIQPQNHQAEISRIMSEMGKKGGKIGGKRRLVTMTPEQRRELAYKAAKARWQGENGHPKQHTP